MKTHTSPVLASPSSPSEQSISPLSGAVSGGHVTTGRKMSVSSFNKTKIL